MDEIKAILEHISKAEATDTVNNLKLIRDEIENGEYGGRYCKDGSGTVYYIVAASSTIEDYYYIGINRQREIHFISCVGEMTPLDEAPLDFSVLNFLIKFEPECIVSDVKRYVESTGQDVFFTKINVGGKLY